MPQANTCVQTCEFIANGNLRYDAHKEIEKIEYNYLNLPEKITFTNDRVITFLYDATGRKLRKTVSGNGQTEQRDYLEGIEYKDGKPDLFHHSEGTVRRDDKGQFRYSFVLRDHLGNTRVTFCDYNDDDKISEKEEIIQINNYYAFGLNMEGNWNGKDGANKYQYNGKELHDDFGLGWNDYGKRCYDPAIGRWNAVDLVAAFFPNESPYNFVGGNPVRYIDVEGMFRIDAYFAAKYPNVTTVIANYLPLLKDNPEAIQAFCEVTGFTEAQFNKIIEFGTGPWVTPTRIYERTLDQSAPYQQQSQYDPELYPENLFINGGSLDALEKLLCNSTNKSDSRANIFVISILIMHEAAHYAHYKVYGKGKPHHYDIKWGGTDKGFDFFLKLFGSKFTDNSSPVDDAFDKDKAREYSKKNEGNTHLFGLSHTGTTAGGELLEKLIWQFATKKIAEIPKTEHDPSGNIPKPPAPNPPCGCFGPHR